MFKPIHHKTATLPLANSISRSPLRRGFLLLSLPLVLTWLALLPTAQAVTPAPDGGYPNNNTAEGTNALFHNTAGGNNTGNGFFALQANTSGNANTATGFEALFNNTIGKFNTANGANALLSNTSGDNNTAEGTNALLFNTTGNFNTAAGFEALFSNTSGSDNTANGVDALLSNTIGSQNTANGVDALFRNTIGNQNTANGWEALYRNTTGSSNTANGLQALISNTSGNDNTANGLAALFSNTTGSNNIALGTSAGSNLTAGDNNIDIGNSGVAAEANTIRIGIAGTQSATYIAGIHGQTTSDSASTVPVVVDMNGNLGTTASSERFKKDIKSMDQNSEAILRLKPVTFHYKNDSKGTPQFGLVAEEVAKVNPDLVVRDARGDIYTVRYEAVNAMLLNEFLKAHRTVQEQGATIAQQQKEIAALAAQLKEQTALIRKVSDRLELSTAPQMVRNHQ